MVAGSPVMELWPSSKSTRAGRAPGLPQVSGSAPVMLLPEMFKTCKARQTCIGRKEETQTATRSNMDKGVDAISSGSSVTLL